MTGYTVHTGSTEKFSEGWDRIFEGAAKKKAAGKAPAAKGSAGAKKAVSKKKKGKK